MVRRSNKLLFLILPLCVSAQTRFQVENLFPAGGQIIETANLTKTFGKSRTLVLWMLRPEKTISSPDSYYCGTEVHGDFWKGPARLSLIDPARHRLINTIKIQFDEERRSKMGDEFWIPFFVSGAYYLPLKNKDKMGKPQILRLRDMTGEGLTAQFPLFIYDACGIVTSGAFGYSATLDEAVQYPVLSVVDGNEEGLNPWVQQIFAREPVSPGQWKFNWKIGHGSDDVFNEDVSFDRARQRFVERRSLVPPK